MVLKVMSSMLRKITFKLAMVIQKMKKNQAGPETFSWQPVDYFLVKNIFPW
jgi:hypothetical protein